jgi:hypothetical protein|tara:strand:- start:8237 stop:8641 length:405 start_codon:yes stop_codon:yes gene_type:complete
MPRDNRDPLVKKLELQQEKSKQLQVDTLLYFRDRAHKKVRSHNEYGRKRIPFQVPIYEMGLPLYDAMWVRNRMIKILRQDGFYVEGVNPTTLIIDWSAEKLEEQREIDYQNDRAKKKKRKEKRIKNSPPKLVKL